jgi:hypothetical protein
VVDIWDIKKKSCHYEKACPFCNRYNDYGKSWCYNSLTISAQADCVLKHYCWDLFAVIVLLQYCNIYYLEQLLSYYRSPFEILISVCPFIILFNTTAHSLPCPLLVSSLCLHRTNSQFTACAVSRLFLGARHMTVLCCTRVFTVRHPAEHRLRQFCCRIPQLHFIRPVLLGSLFWVLWVSALSKPRVLIYLWSEWRMQTHPFRALSSHAVLLLV